MLIISKNVSKDYRESNKSNIIFSNINLTINQSHSYAIVGSSGVGKSTLLHLLGNLDQPTIGSIEFVPEETDSKSENLFAYIFQEHNLLQELTVKENLMLPLLIRGYSWKNAEIKINKLLNELNLSELTSYFLYQLSGGQKQRIAVIRAVAQNAKFILADEPSANLDEENAQLVVDLLLRIKNEYKIGIIICSHDPLVYSRMDYLIKIFDKKISLQPNTEGAHQPTLIN